MLEGNRSVDIGVDPQLLDAGGDAIRRWPAGARRWLDDVARYAAASIAGGNADACSAIGARLRALSARFQPAEAGLALGIAMVVEAAPAPGTDAELEPTELAARMLRQLLADDSLSNRSLAARLRVDESQVSRAGRQLVQSHLAIKVRRGRTNRWIITPRGRAAIVPNNDEPRPTAVSVDSAIDALHRATRPSEVTAAAQALHHLGVRSRGSSLPRGSLVQDATRRISPSAEARLIAIASGHRDEPLHATIAAVGEWCGEEALLALEPILGRESTTDDLLAMIGAAGKIGGLKATEFLVRLAGMPAGTSRDVVADHAIGALRVLAHGGIADTSEPAPTPHPSARWWTSDPAGARAVLERAVAGLADASNLPGMPSTVRRSARTCADEIAAWASLNDVLVPTPGVDIDDARTDDVAIHPEVIAEFLDDIAEMLGRQHALAAPATFRGEPIEYAFEVSAEQLAGLAPERFPYSTISIRVDGRTVTVRGALRKGVPDGVNPLAVHLRVHGARVEPTFSASSVSHRWTADIDDSSPTIVVAFG